MGSETVAVAALLALWLITLVCDSGYPRVLCCGLPHLCLLMGSEAVAAAAEAALATLAFVGRPHMLPSLAAMLELATGLSRGGGSWGGGLHSCRSSSQCAAA